MTSFRNSLSSWKANNGDDDVIAVKNEMAIHQIQREADPITKKHLINDFLVSNDSTYNRIARSIARQYAGRSAMISFDEIVQIIRETAVWLIDGHYNPATDSYPFESRLVLKSRERVRNFAISNKVTGERMKSPVVRDRGPLQRVRDDLMTSLKREPTEAEVRNEFIKLHGREPNTDTQVFNQKIRVDDPAAPKELSLNQYEETFIRINGVDGEVSSVEISEILNAILAECGPPDSPTYRYALAWMEIVASGNGGDGKIKFPTGLIAERLGVSNKEVLSMKTGFQGAISAVIKALSGTAA